MSEQQLAQFYPEMYGSDDNPVNDLSIIPDDIHYWGSIPNDIEDE